MNQKTTTNRHSYTTKDDFLRWLRERKIQNEKHAAEEQTTQDQLKSDMVWADDGGAARSTVVEGDA
jgi:hypothetical protein